MRTSLGLVFHLAVMWPLQAQFKADSVLLVAPQRSEQSIDSLIKKSASAQSQAVQRVDSIRSVTQFKIDSLQHAYMAPINNLNAMESKYQHKIDSLQKLSGNPDRILLTYKGKLDSVTKARTQQVTELDQKIESTKTKAIGSLDRLELPQDVREPVNRLKESIRSYKIPMIDGKMPQVGGSAGKLPGINLPQGNFKAGEGKGQMPGMGSNDPLSGITKETQQLSTVTNQAGTYTRDMKNITSGNLNEVKTLDKKLEGEALNMKGTEELKAKTAELEKYKKQMDIKPDSLSAAHFREEATKQFTRDAVNHFAGQEVLLKDAMSQMDKYKKKYKDVKNIAELPKKLPNPLHGMPFIERVTPGTSFQMYNRTGVQVDINAYAIYQITPRFSSGVGWVERVGFSDKVSPQARVYGPRAAFRMDWTKGITFTFQPELLNTYVQPQLINSPGITEGRREWVWSGMVTVRKAFRFRKNIYAFTELLYNLHNPQSKSPYPDPLMMRFGFEFKLHKKKSQDSR